MGKCQNCGKEYPYEILDGKPRRLRGGQNPDQVRELELAADRGEQFDWLEGPCCYGPGYAEC